MVERSLRACAALRIPEIGDPIVVACSGGPDSAAALDLIRAARPKARIIACYVDHGIRPAQSIRRDIAAVRAQARACGALVVVKRAEMGSMKQGSLEFAARKARYEALARVAQTRGARFVVTGHHRDDLAESLLLALVRGSGVDGAASMRARRSLKNGISLVRPFLWAGKKELAAHARSKSMPISMDETNADARFSRNAIRLLLEGLEQVAPGARRTLARSAALFAGDKMLLDRLTHKTWLRCGARAKRAVPASEAGGHDNTALSAAALRVLPTPLLLRVIRYAVRRAAGVEDFHLTHCTAIASALKAHRGGTFHAGANANVILSAGKLRVQPHRFGQRAAPARHTQLGAPARHMQLDAPARDTQLNEPITIHLPDAEKVAALKTPYGRLTMRWYDGNRPPKGTTLLCSDVLTPGMAMQIRRPRTGDTCIPSGRHHAVSLARFLAKSGVPRDKRRHASLLCWRDEVAAVLGMRVMKAFSAKKGQMLAIAWRPSR